MDSYTHDFPPGGATNACTWTRPPPRGAPPPTLILLQLWVMPFAERIFEADKYSAGQENVIGVSGLGDDAYRAQIGPMTILNVKKGSIEVQVTWVGSTDHQTVMDAEKTIAAQVLSEL